MTAIITNQFRLNAAKELVDDLYNNSNYYLFIGRTDAWDTSTPENPYDNTYSFDSDAWQRMIAMKKISDLNITYAAPRYQWISGTTYDEYDDRDTSLDTKAYYVISDNNHVYICLKSGGTSTKNPDIAGITKTGVIDYTADDGYIWKYLFTISTEYSNNFLTSAFIPVRFIETVSDDSPDAEIDQRDVQNNAVQGAIYNIKISNAGTGYDQANPPSVTITGDGTGATASAVVAADGTLTDIQMTSYGSGYNHAAVTISGSGQDATAYAVMGPRNGFGADPRNDLRAHYVAINVKLQYEEGQGDFLVGNSYRQIGIIRNPIAREFDASGQFEASNVTGTVLATGDTYSATRSLVVATGASFPINSTIVGTVTGAKAIVDVYDSVNGIIRYHHTEETGYTEFTTQDNVLIDGETGAGQDITKVYVPEVVHYTGECIFLENRTAVLRASDQIETIKLVLEF